MCLTSLMPFEFASPLGFCGAVLGLLQRAIVGSKVHGRTQCYPLQVTPRLQAPEKQLDSAWPCVIRSHRAETRLNVTMRKRLWMLDVLICALTIFHGRLFQVDEEQVG